MRGVKVKRWYSLDSQNGGSVINDKSTIIIGAGIAGLSAGCCDHMNGYCPQIFEMHGELGGGVTTAAMSDRNVTELICMKDNSPFITRVL